MIRIYKLLEKDPPPTLRDGNIWHIMFANSTPGKNAQLAFS